MEVKAIPVAYTMANGKLEMNCYLLISAHKNCAVIDPGAQHEKILKEIKNEGLALKYIMLTHGHFDHIGAVNKLLEAFPDAKVYIGEHDLEMLIDVNKSYAALVGNSYDNLVISGAESLKDSQELRLDELSIKIIFTPGHTKGSVTYLCENTLFTGDTLFRGSIGRTDLYGGDMKLLSLSLQKLMMLDGDYTVYSGHGRASTLEFERKTNPFLN